MILRSTKRIHVFSLIDLYKWEIWQVVTFLSLTVVKGNIKNSNVMSSEVCRNWLVIYCWDQSWLVSILQTVNPHDLRSCEVT